MELLWTLRIRQAIGKRLFKLLSARRFGRFGARSWVIAPNAVLNPANIRLGDDVLVANNCVLAAVPHTGVDCTLEIGDGCQIGHFNHIYATRSVVLGKNVLTANGVYI
ncbi:MAG: acyltransferase, partial [Burkholderiales bacterium]